MINEVINTLKERVPEAFFDEQKETPPYIPIKEKIERFAEPLPFQRFFIAEEFPRVSPSNLIPITSDVPEDLFDDEELREEVKDYGTDALGWYQPFHFFARWGIYIRWRGIKYLCFFLGCVRSRYKSSEAYAKAYANLIRLAFNIIYQHEYFHFLTEWASSFLELSLTKSLYKDYFKLKHNDVPDIEESLANAYAFRQIKSRFHNKVSKFFSLQPEIYRNYISYIRDKEFVYGKRRLGIYITVPSTVEILATLLVDEDKVIPYEGLFVTEPTVLYAWEVPLYLVFEKDKPPQVLQFISAIHNVRIMANPKDHKPRHIHVWIPADSKLEKRLCWPNYEVPLDGSPLSKSKLKRLEKALLSDKMKERIENAISHIPICPPCTKNEFI